MAKNFPELVTDTKPQIQEDAPHIQEVQRIPSKVNTKILHRSMSCSDAENQR